MVEPQSGSKQLLGGSFDACECNHNHAVNHAYCDFPLVAKQICRYNSQGSLKDAKQESSAAYEVTSIGALWQSCTVVSAANLLMGIFLGVTCGT